MSATTLTNPNGNNTERSQYTAPLQYIPFTNNNSSLAALVDSGSQLNLVEYNLLPYLEFQPFEHQIKALWGVSGRQSTINQWILIKVTLTPSHTYQIPCAVLDHLPCSILMGMPFLQQIRATHDIPNALLHTPYGPIPLLQPKFRYRRLSVNNVRQPAYQEVPGHLFNESNLTYEERKQVEALLTEFADLWKNGRRGEATNVAHRIRLRHPYPIVMKPRPVTEEQKKIIKGEIDLMLQEGVIRPSHSPYAQEVVLVLKRTGDWRFCVDYRAVNKVTIPDAYPLPRISDLINSIKQSSFFTVLDLKAGYWQIPMEADSIKYTAFRCFMGLFEFCVMPFGLTNAPATFQRCMDYLFGDHRFKGILCYLDDILVHASNFPHALTLLRRVFERLRKEGLTISLNKCLFFPKRLRYLGQVIQDGQILPDPTRIEALRRIEAPKTIHDVRSLLGFIGYYQTHIKNHAGILTPVYDLLKEKKNKKRLNATTPVQWTAEHQAAVNHAIDTLAHSTLSTPLDSDEFQIETDASSRSIAGILSVRREQDWKPVEFYSKTLSKTQRNWPVREKEAYAIIMSLQKFDSYVRGRNTTLLTDHESLRWMLDCPKGKIARWASILAEYPVKIFYKRGSEMIPVDFLTRFLDEEPDPILPRMCYFTTTEPIPALEDILKVQQQEPKPNAKGFSTHNNISYYHGLIYAPTTYRKEIIASCHSLVPFHHPGIKKTKRIINRTFNWPGLHQDVVRYIHSCLYCRRARSGRERLQGLQRTHPIPTAFHTIYMDFWQVRYNHQPYKLLTIIDQLTKWVECCPVGDSTALTVSTILLHHWIYRFGVPHVLVTDREPSFTSDLIARITAALGTTHLKSTPYHPEGNAVIESFHRTLSTGLRFFNPTTTSFLDALHNILFGYRTTLHSTTGHSPSYLVYGTDLRLALDRDWRLEEQPDTAERLRFLSTLRLDIQLRAQQHLACQNRGKNQVREPKEFEEGQLVLCHLQPLQRLQYKATAYKAYPRWSLPFRVVRVLKGRTSAIVRCLLTQSCRQVHIQDVRFILPPEGKTQQQEWKDIVEQEVLSMYDEAQAKEVLNRFFDDISLPQLFDLGSSTSAAPVPGIGDLPLNITTSLPSASTSPATPGPKRRRAD